MAFEYIQIAADGVLYDQWESIRIDMAVKDPVVSCTLATTELGGFGGAASMFTEWNFPPGTIIEVLASGDICFRGRVYMYNPSADSDQHNITIVANSPTRDYVSSSVDDETGNYQNTTDVAILEEHTKKVNVVLENHTVPQPVANFQIKQGSTYYNEGMRLIVPRAKMLTARAKSGNLALIEGEPFVRFAGVVVQGENIISMSAKLTDEDFYAYRVNGQNPVGIVLPDHLQPTGVAYNFSKPKHRYKLLLDQLATTNAQAQRRADWERRRGVGSTTQASVRVLGWRDAHGAFWEQNCDVYVYAPWLQIDCLMRTESVTLIQNLGQGTVTDMTLVDPLVYDGQPSVCKSHDAWLGGFNIKHPEGE